jgi:hypothetical protein
MPPLWVVRDMTRHLKLLRRKKDVLLPTKRGREFLVNPQAFFDLIATDYLYSYVHVTDRQEDVQARLRWWRMFLNLLNIKAREGCTPLEIVKILKPDFAPLSDTEMTLEAWELKSDLLYGVLRRLCWLGLLYEAREGLTLFQDGSFHKTPLWASLPAAGIGYAKRHRRALTIFILPLAASSTLSLASQSHPDHS